MPENPTPRPGADVIGGLAAKFGEQALARFFGDVPEEDKAAILDGLASTLQELTVINRYFAEQIFNKFGDEDTGELRKKPDIRDFLTCWTEATIRLMAEEELAKAGATSDDDDGDGDAGGDDGSGDEAGGGDGNVVDAEFRRVR